MRKPLLLLLLLLLLSARPCFAAWIWTPETNKWVNPKWAVKDTPSEQLDYALGFYKSKDYKQAIQELQKLIKNYPRAKEAPDAQYYLGLIDEEETRLYDAFKDYQIVIDKYPFSERAPEIIERQFKIGEKLLEGANNRGKFMEALAGTDYNVIDVFKAVIKNAPYGKLAPQAQYQIGLYLLGKGLFQEARDEFEKVMNDYPDSEWVKPAQYQIAIADSKRSTNPQYDQKITGTAVEEFKKFVEINPDAELSERAKRQIDELKGKEAENNFIVAEFYEKQKNYKAAKIYYKIVADDYKNTRFVARALNKIREMSIKE